MQIGLDLASMGYLNSKGEAYSGTSLAKMLNNPRYKGYYTAKLTEIENYKTHKKKKVPKEKQIIEKDDRIPAIVSEELWNKANQIHEERKKKAACNVLNSQKFISSAKYSCKIVCKECGAFFVRNSGSTRNQPTWSCKTYRKSGVHVCPSPMIKESYLDNIFIDVFNNIIKNKSNFISQLLNDYKEIIECSKANFGIDKINKKIEWINKQKDKLLDLSIKCIISDAEFKLRNDKYNSDIELLQEEKEKIDNFGYELERKMKKIDNIKSKIYEKIDIKNQLPDLMKLLVEKVEVEKINGARKDIKLNIYFSFVDDYMLKN